MCRGYKGIKIFFNYYGVKNIGTKLYMNSTITVTEDIKHPPTVIIIIMIIKGSGIAITQRVVDDAGDKEVSVEGESGHL